MQCVRDLLAATSGWNRRVILLSLAVPILLIPGCSSTSSGATGRSPVLRGTLVSDATIPASGTFAFTPRSGIANDPRLPTQEVDSLIEEAVIASMGRRGFRPTQEGTPDLMVAFVAGAGSTLEDAGFQPLPGTRPDWRDQSLDPRRYEQGLLVIDLLDSAGHKTLWRGTAQGVVLFELSLDQRRQRIDALVEDLLSRFRP